MSRATKVAITGAAGFGGANLIQRLLADGAEVVALVRPRGETTRLAQFHGIAIEEADIVDTPALTNCFAKHRPEIVFHLASTGWSTAVSPSEHHRVIVEGARSLAAALEAAPPNRLIATGSGAEYGPGIGFTEDQETLPNTPLGSAKKEAFEILTGWAARTHAQCVWLRLFTPFGPWESQTRLVPSAIRAVLTSQPLLLRAATSRRDFISAGDTAGAMIRSMTAPLPNVSVLNICRGESTSVANLVNRIADLAGSRCRIEFGGADAAPDPLPESSGSSEKAQELLGWKPSTSLDPGIEEAITWWKERIQ